MSVNSQEKTIIEGEHGNLAREKVVYERILQRLGIEHFFFDTGRNITREWGVGEPVTNFVDDRYNLICSYHAYRYPYLTTQCSFPTEEDIRVWFGFELGGSTQTPALFHFYDDGGTDYFQAKAGAGLVNRHLTLDIMDRLKGLTTDYNDVNQYQLKVGKGVIEFYINWVLAAVIVTGVGLPDFSGGDATVTSAGTNTGEYAVGVASIPVPPGSSSLVEAISPENTSFEWNIQARDFRVVEGMAHPPRSWVLRASSDGSAWDSLDTGGSVQTSRPIPIQGYKNKTVYFKSDAGGDLDIEIYTATGSWEVYDTISVTADELEVYSITNKAPLVRCVYTPTDSDTINLGEVHLS